MPRRRWKRRERAIDDGSGRRSYLTVYVAVDDLDKYLKRAEELGGSTVLGPMPVRGIGAFAMLCDPDGNIVGLFREAA